MKDHEIRELISALAQVARDFHAAQQLRERIVGLVLPAFNGPNGIRERVAYAVRQSQLYAPDARRANPIAVGAKEQLANTIEELSKLGLLPPNFKL
jgi:alkanesulfonate monooxygenase SsuD/methylene tetrahydromethanopterin reductase-like flavin-dependent oxidoreductase (luciferase family)